MRAEARENAEEKMATHADYAKKSDKDTPVLHVREGDIKDELLALIDEEPDISLLVLGADTKQKMLARLSTF